MCLLLKRRECIEITKSLLLVLVKLEIGKIILHFGFKKFSKTSFEF